MDFYQIITLLFSFLGLMNGLFAAGLFRLKRFYLYGIAGALISCGAVQYYVWYALAYPEYGWAAHFGAYFACALMAADIMLILALSFDDDRYGAVYPQVCADFWRGGDGAFFIHRRLWFCGWRNEGRGGAVYDCRRRTAGSL